MKSTRLIISLVLLVFALPFFVATAKWELSQWFDAIALEAQLNNDVEGAINWMTRSVQLQPYDPTLKMQLAALKADAERIDAAIADVDEALVQLRGRFEQNPNLSNQFALASGLNHGAYLRALQQSDLVTAKAMIDECLLLAAGGDSWGLSAFLDTRALIEYELSDYESALESMNDAVELTERVAEITLVQRRQSGQLMIDQRPVELQIRQIRKHQEEIYRHRADVFRALGRQQEAAADLHRAAKYRP